MVTQWLPHIFAEHVVPSRTCATTKHDFPILEISGTNEHIYFERYSEIMFWSNCDEMKSGL